jgi:predicted ATP-binding protein involved in virulence
MKLTVKDFAVIKNAEIDLRGLTVLSGPNGSGKTTVLEVLINSFEVLKNTPKIMRQFAMDSFIHKVQGFIVNYKYDNSEQNKFIPPNIIRSSTVVDRIENMFYNRNNLDEVSHKLSELILEFSTKGTPSSTVLDKNIVFKDSENFFEDEIYPAYVNPIVVEKNAISNFLIISLNRYLSQIGRASWRERV